MNFEMNAIASEEIRANSIHELLSIFNEKFFVEKKLSTYTVFYMYIIEVLVKDVNM